MDAAEQQLEEEYRASVYVIHSGADRIETRIDQPCERLAAVLARCCVTSAALISACNPDSEPMPAELNLLRQRELEDALSEQGYAFLPALGRSEDGHWQEPSVLVLGFDAAAARDWAGRWQQRAYVLYDAAGRGRLCYVEDGCR